MTLVAGQLVVTKGPGTKKVGVVVSVGAKSMFQNSSKLCHVLLAGEEKPIAFMSDQLRKVHP